MVKRRIARLLVSLARSIEDLAAWLQGDEARWDLELRRDLEATRAVMSKWAAEEKASRPNYIATTFRYRGPEGETA